MKKPIVTEIFTYKGEHSHYVLIDPSNGNILWSEFSKKSRDCDSFIEFDEIMNVICEYYNTSLAFFSQKSNKPKIVRGRQIFYYLVKKIYKSKFTLKEIGNYFRCNHATVLWGIGKIQDMIDTNDKYGIDCNRIELMIKNREL